MWVCAAIDDDTIRAILLDMAIDLTARRATAATPAL
jgi:hypothetical protein